MSGISATNAEVKSDGLWVGVSVDKITTQRQRPTTRCAECHGRVRAHRMGSNGLAAHFEHLDRHAGCSAGFYFDGKRSLHPSALS